MITARPYERANGNAESDEGAAEAKPDEGTANADGAVNANAKGNGAANAEYNSTARAGAHAEAERPQDAKADDDAGDTKAKCAADAKKGAKGATGDCV